MRGSHPIASPAVLTAGCLFVSLLGIAGCEDIRSKDKDPTRGPQTLPAESVAEHQAAYQQVANRRTERRKKAEELRQRYPYESLSERLKYEEAPLENSSRPTVKLSKAVADRLTAQEAGDEWGAIRARSLAALHSEEVDKFIEREGFGLERAPRSPGLEYIELPPVSPIPFAAGRLAPENVGPSVKLPATGPAFPGTGPRVPSIDILAQFHLQGEHAFADPYRFGHIKDRDHVAGFQPHAFTNLPELTAPVPPGQEPKADHKKWVVRRLELVSLLKHEEPVAYQSANLPRMEELRKAQTRDLTAFESQALKVLQGGEDLVVDATTNRIVMMGAVRARKACLECHHGKRGELLGTFSYELHRDPPLKAMK